MLSQEKKCSQNAKIVALILSPFSDEKTEQLTI